MNALAAIGPAASAAIPALEKYAAKDTPTPEQANSLYALYCIRDELADLRKIVALLTDAKVDTETERHVAKLLNQLGAQAGPVAEEIRRLLESGTPSALQEELKSFLEKVEKGEEPGVSFEW